MGTYFFSNSIGVFEGGGVRAAAFAGAYAEAARHGMTFSAVAGTSAGSLVAALLAAGATSEFLLEKLVETGFSDLLKPPHSGDRPYAASGSSLASVGRFSPGYIGSIATVVHHSGLHSSRPIEEWVEDLLKTLLAAESPSLRNRPVTFRDLRLPLFIVSADVFRGTERVWSQESTPDESVAFAVRCSCAIPFFFQAVKGSGGSVYVDGGLISNLPSYVFAASGGSAGRYSERIVAFRLRSSKAETVTQFNDFQEFATAIADVVVSAGTSIQLKLQDNIYPLEIDTGLVQATDFGKMTPEVQKQLVEAGTRAVRSFVGREKEILSRSRERTVYEGYDERLLAYVHMLQNATRTVTFCDSSSYWLYYIFPALFCALRRGIAVDLLTPPGVPDEREEARRRLLTTMGVKLVAADAIGFVGLLKDIRADDARAALTTERGDVGQDFDYAAGQTRVYSSDDDLPVIKSIRHALPAGVATGPMNGPSALAYGELDHAQLFTLLKRVPQYAAAKFELIDAPIKPDLRCMQSRIKEYKLLQIAEFIDDFQSGGLQLFAPGLARLAGTESSVITPPILEEVDGAHVVIEGHTRAYYCLTNNISSVKAVLVRGVKEPLPGGMSRLGDTRISSRTIKSRDLFQSFVKQRFRRIEECVHQ